MAGHLYHPPSARCNLEVNRKNWFQSLWWRNQTAAASWYSCSEDIKTNSCIRCFHFSHCHCNWSAVRFSVEFRRRCRLFMWYHNVCVNHRSFSQHCGFSSRVNHLNNTSSIYGESLSLCTAVLAWHHLRLSSAVFQPQHPVPCSR